MSSSLRASVCWICCICFIQLCLFRFLFCWNIELNCFLDKFLKEDVEEHGSSNWLGFDGVYRRWALWLWLFLITSSKRDILLLSLDNTFSWFISNILSFKSSSLISRYKNHQFQKTTIYAKIFSIIQPDLSV